jgi:hypothetical protein
MSKHPPYIPPFVYHADFGKSLTIKNLLVKFIWDNTIFSIVITYGSIVESIMRLLVLTDKWKLVQRCNAG